MIQSQKKKIFLGLITLFLIGYGIAYLVQSNETTKPSTLSSSAGIDATLPPFDPMSAGKVVKDEATGREFLSNQIIVEFVPGTSEQAALDAIAEYGGTMLQRFTAVPMFLIRVNDDGDGVTTRKILDRLRGDARVKYAELNFLTTLDTGS